MKLVLQQLGIEVECSCDEFKEIYPALHNGKAVIESKMTALKSKPAAKEEKSPYRKGSNPQEVLEFMQRHPNKSFTAIDLVGKVSCTEQTLHGVLSRLARDGRIKRSEKGHYTFFESDLEDAEPITLGNHIIRSQHDLGDANVSSIQNIQEEGVRIEPSEELSEEIVKEMWKHVKPLFEIGKPVADSQIMKMLGNVERKVCYKWIVQACNAGLIEADPTSGFYKIVRAEPLKEYKETKPARKQYKKPTAEELEQLKENILEVMRSEPPSHRWLPKHIAIEIGLQNHRLYKMLTELVEEGKIHRCHSGNGMNPNKQKLYYSLEIGEPEPAPAPTVLNEQVESTSVI